MVAIERQLVRQGSLPQKRNSMFIDPSIRKAHGAAVEDDHIHFMRKGKECIPSFIKAN